MYFHLKKNNSNFYAPIKTENKIVLDVNKLHYSRKRS